MVDRNESVSGYSRVQYGRNVHWDAALHSLSAGHLSSATAHLVGTSVPRTTSAGPAAANVARLQHCGPYALD